METYLSKFEEGSANFQALLGTISSNLENERATLEKHRQELEQERKLFEQECNRVQQVGHSCKEANRAEEQSDTVCMRKRDACLCCCTRSFTTPSRSH